MTLAIPRTWHFHAPELKPEADIDTPDRATWVLGLGIIALVFSPLGLFAWMAGSACLKSIAEGRMDPVCESNARAGRLLGMIAIGLFCAKVTALTAGMLIFGVV